MIEVGQGKVGVGDLVSEYIELYLRPGKTLGHLYDMELCRRTLNEIRIDVVDLLFEDWQREYSEKMKDG